MNIGKILEKAVQLQPITKDEAVYVYMNARLPELMMAAHGIRMKLHPENSVSWIIDRNVNITNVCVSQCMFCNFCRKKTDVDAYITSMEEYVQKIDEMVGMGGSQLLLQGGMHPDLGLGFYITLFAELKKLYPALKLHALGPPEIVYLAKKDPQMIALYIRHIKYKQSFYGARGSASVNPELIQIRPTVEKKR